MSHNNKKNKQYTLYTLTPERSAWYSPADYFSWHSNRYSRENLVQHLTNMLLCSDGSIDFDRIKTDMTASKCEFTEVVFGKSLYTQYNYKNLYYVVKNIGEEEIPVDIEALKNDIKKAAERKIQKRNKKAAIKSQKTHKHIYRYDSVPYTGGKRYLGKYYRRPRIKCILTYQTDVDVIKNCRDTTDLSDVDFGTKPRHLEKSWKSQHKGRKQWDRGDSRRIITAGHDKRYIFDYEDDFDMLDTLEDDFYTIMKMDEAV